MAVYTTATAVGIREDLSDKIYRISPHKTPVLSMARMGGGEAKATEVEWQVDELAAAVGDNAHAEGAPATFTEPDPTVRLSNTCQIMRKTVEVSGTLDAVETAGRKRETSLQKFKRAEELKTDIEKTLTQDQAKVTSGTRKMGTLSSWITNIDRGTNSAAIPAGVGKGTAVPPTGGTKRDISLDLFSNAMQLAADQGGTPTIAIVSNSMKVKFSKLANNDANSNAPARMDHKSGHGVTITRNVTLYASDFGPVGIMPDVFTPNDRIYLLDPENYGFQSLPGRNMVSSPLGKDGDSTKSLLINEATLVVGAPKAHAEILDLN